ncbi:MAG: Calx-beta domain-containing protein [Chloroflexota bacterium]
MNHIPAKHMFRVSIMFIPLLIIVVTFMVILLSASTIPSVAAAPEADPTVAFKQSSLTLNESAGAVSVEVQLNITSTNEVKVSYETVAGTATNNVDYTFTTGQLTFPANTLTQTIALTIREDTIYEGTTDEFFYVDLFSPISATIGTNRRLTVLIRDNETQPTATPTSGTPTTFSDNYEPNNTLGTAYTIAADAAKTCSITLWPAGDEDYFSFVGKAGSAYKIYTSSLTAGLDTEIYAYNTHGNLVAQNDDVQQGDLASLVYLTANVDGFYYVRVINRDPSNPAGKTYCIEVDEIDPPTPTPSQTPVPGADECEFNSTAEYACILEVGEENAKSNMSFVPVFGSSQDTDYYKVWMRQGTYYTCETIVNEYADTNMIFKDQYNNDFQPNLGNNDKEPGDYGSKLSLLAPYTGWLYVIVGPVVAPPYEESFLHQYSIQCIAEVATPTPTPSVTPTFAPVVGPPSGGTSPTAAPTATPFVFPTFPATPTPIDLSVLTPSPSPTPIVVNVQPLPTATPFGGGQQNISINVTLYYDSNFNFLPELNEGVMDVAVALYDNASGSLIAFGSTNEAGSVSFTSIATAGAVRVVVPFLNYSQVVIGGSSNILVRIAPQPLPIGIP